MNRSLLSLALVVAVAGTGCTALNTVGNSVGGSLLPPSAPVTYDRVATDLNVWSGSFQAYGRLPEAQVYQGMGCTGANRSPQLAWSNPPVGTKSYAVIGFDPDAPTGLGFVHWVAFDIPASTTSLPEGLNATNLPAGAVQGFTDLGAAGYGGACPPAGSEHRYEFTVYALDVDHVGGSATTTAALLRFLMRGHVLAQGTIVAKYSR